MLSLAVAALLTFHDVPKSSWAYPDVVLLASSGVLHGETDGSFLPAGEVSRQQAAATLARAIALPAASLGDFHDGSQVSPTLRADVARAVHAGVLEGTTGGYLMPRDPLTRAAAAALLARAFKIAPLTSAPGFKDAASIPPYAQGYVAALEKAGVAEGDVKGDFLPERPVTRAEWAALLLRAAIAAGGAPGAPSLVAGKVTSAFPPDDPALAASSSLGGQAGALEIGSRTVSLAQGALVYRQGSPAGFFAIGEGDEVAAWAAQDGTLALVEDLRASAPDPDQGVVRDVSPTALFLGSGKAFSELPVSVAYQGRTLRLAAFPTYLLWAKVTAQVTKGQLSLSVRSPYAFDLQGEIVGISQGSMTLRLSSSSALSVLVPGLSAGSLVEVGVGQDATIAGVGANGPAAPAIGLMAQVMGYWGGSRVLADRVTLSQ